MCFACSLAACSVHGSPCWRLGFLSQVWGSAKIILTESHAKLAWDCIPCMSKILLKYRLQFRSCRLLLEGITHHCICVASLAAASHIRDIMIVT